MTTTPNPYLAGALGRYPSQAKAADAWGISPQYACDIARGRRRVPPRLALRIEAACGISATDLYTWQARRELCEAELAGKLP